MGRARGKPDGPARAVYAWVASSGSRFSSFRSTSSMSLTPPPWSPPVTTLPRSSPRDIGSPPTTRSSSAPTPTLSLPSGRLPAVAVRRADSQPVVAVGRPVTDNRNECNAREMSGAEAAVGHPTVIADGGYGGTGLGVPPRRERGESEHPDRKDEHDRSHRKGRARVEHHQRLYARTWRARVLHADGMSREVLTLQVSNGMPATVLFPRSQGARQGLIGMADRAVFLY